MRTEAPTAPALVHERTLRGAIDAYAGTLVHTRPWLASGYIDALECVADAWIGGGGENWLAALDRRWLERHLWGLEGNLRDVTRSATSGLLARAAAEGLLDG